MTIHQETPTAPHPLDTIAVSFEGGPIDMTCHRLMQRVDVEQDRIKIPHRNGYEHFERTSDRTGEAQLSFRWKMRTMIAE